MSCFVEFPIIQNIIDKISIKPSFDLKGRLQAYLEGLSAAGTIDIEIPSIPGKRSVMERTLEVRYHL